MTDFHETNWSLIWRATQGHQDAIGELYAIYQVPLLAFARYELRLDDELAEELVQGFSVHAFVEGRLLAAATPDKGRFRSYLRVAFRNFVCERWRREGVLKQQPDASSNPTRPEDLDVACQSESPLQILEKAWVLQVLAKALARWKHECYKKGDSRRWRVFELRILRPIWSGVEPLPYEQIRLQLGYRTPKCVMNIVTGATKSLRKHVRVLLQEELTRGADLGSVIRQRGEQLACQQPDMSAEICQREAERAVKQELEEAIDAELADFGNILRGGTPPQRVRMRRETRADVSAEVSCPISLPAAANSGARVIFHGSLEQFFSAHLEVPLPNPTEPSASPTADQILVPPDPAACDLQGLLAALLEPESEPSPALPPDPLSAQLEQLLAAPLPWATATGVSASDQSAAQQEPPFRSLGELLNLRQPPLEEVVRLKDFAWTHREHNTTLHKEVATVLYFAAIAQAHLRCDERITSLSDNKLQHGMDWVLSQSWVDGCIRSLLREATGRLRSPAQRPATAVSD